MRVQLVLAALVSLAAAFYYPSISDDQASQTYEQAGYNRNGRYLWVNESNTASYYSMVVNTTTLAIAGFYLGTIGLGMYSLWNDAANTVAKHKLAKGHSIEKYKMAIC